MFLDMWFKHIFFHLYKWFYLRTQLPLNSFSDKAYSFSFLDHAFCIKCMNSVNLKFWRFSIMISLKGVVLCFTHKYIIHFVSLFVKGGRLNFWLISLQMFHHNTLKKISLVLWNVSAPLSISNWTFLYWCISHFSILFIDLCVILSTISMLFWLL